MPAFARPDSDAPWRPSPTDLADSRAARLVRAGGFGRDASAGLESFQTRAVEDPGWFWASPPTISSSPGSAARRASWTWPAGPARARWWTGGAFNHGVAATEPWAHSRPDDAALAWEGEDGAVRTLHLGRARSRGPPCRRAVSPRSAWGRGPGSASSCRCSQRPRSRSSRSAGSGQSSARSSAASRPRRSPPGCAAFEATHLITADGFLRRGAVVPLKAVADEAVELAPGVRRVVVVRRLGRAAFETADRPGRDVDWAPEPAPAGDADASVREAGDVDAVPATDPEAPYMVIYTSGTTGQPKGTVHVHGGFPIKAAQDLAHTFDLRAGRHPVLVHRPRLDDGPVGDQRSAPPRRPARDVRGRSRLARRRTAVVARRPSPDHPFRGQPDARPRPQGPRRGAGPRPRPRLAPGHRLDRRAVEPRSVALVLRGRRRRAPADRQLLGRDRGRRRDRRLLAPPTDPADELQRSVHRDGRRRRGR